MDVASWDCEEPGHHQSELRALLRGRHPVHVTALAAACLRAVDPAALDQLLAESGPHRRYRRIRRQAQRALEAAVGPRHMVYPDTLVALDRIAAHDGATSARVSLGARAVAQALHDTRDSRFWSYFSDWTEPRRLHPGDPFPVPASPRLHEIYRHPLQLACPDTREAPHGVCPGGLRGLPSLRLMPACADGDVYLDPSLDRDLCPLATGNAGSGAAAIVIPAEHLDRRYDCQTVGRDDARVVNAAYPRGTADDIDRLIDDVMADLRRAGRDAALAVLPELTSTPALDDAIHAAMLRGDLGNTELVVAGSSWIPSSDVAGDNRAAILPRGSDRRHHYKFACCARGEAGEHCDGRRKRITILAGERLTFTTLICSDALEAWVPGVLQELRVRLVVVPSCHPGVAAYLPFARTISALGGGTVVLANIPPAPSAPAEYALVVRPVVEREVSGGERLSELHVTSNYRSLILLDIVSVGAFS